MFFFFICDGIFGKNFLFVYLGLCIFFVYYILINFLRFVWYKVFRDFKGVFVNWGKFINKSKK